jgi:hypothetical protein
MRGPPTMTYPANNFAALLQASLTEQAAALAAKYRRMTPQEVWAMVDAEKLARSNATSTETV